MEDFIQKVINDTTNTPPLSVNDAFAQKFALAQNIDWHLVSGNYEAIFYLNQFEHIAIFTPQGALVSCKIFLEIHHLPVNLKQLLETRGEIMNVVLINKGYDIEYEVILRDNQLTRFVVHLNYWGQILSEKQL
jgi:hypothetical protein